MMSIIITAIGIMLFLMFAFGLTSEGLVLVAAAILIGCGSLGIEIRAFVESILFVVDEPEEYIGGWKKLGNSDDIDVFDDGIELDGEYNECDEDDEPEDNK